MKCQTLFSGKNKKSVLNLSSAELAKRAVMIKQKTSPIYILLVIQVNRYTKVPLKDTQMYILNMYKKLSFMLYLPINRNQFT